MIRHRLFRFPSSRSWEDACQEVETWINDNVAAENLISVMMEDNEERIGDDVVVVWYRTDSKA